MNGKPPILELFAGCASLSKAFCRHGFTVHAFDIQWGPGGDILNQDVFRKLLASISRGVFSFVHFGMPCESWSRARKHDITWGLHRCEMTLVFFMGLEICLQETQKRLNVATVF